MCRLYGRNRSPLIVGLCDPCSDHFQMLDCRVEDAGTLEHELEKRLEELEQLRRKNAGRWRRKTVKADIHTDDD
jgi:hypothetical protein